MRAGPKRAVSAPPLDLSHLPGSGVARVDAFAQQFLVVPQGSGARQPFRLRPWQKDIARGLLPSEGVRPRQGVVTLPRGNGKSGLASPSLLFSTVTNSYERPAPLSSATGVR